MVLCNGNITKVLKVTILFKFLLAGTFPITNFERLDAPFGMGAGKVGVELELLGSWLKHLPFIEIVAKCAKFKGLKPN